MSREQWDGSIENAREGQYSNLSQSGPDGNREYPNGTYGQSDYTVRERIDGSYDVYTKNGDNHTHDRIDSDGNLLDNYHDYLAEKLSMLNEKQLEYISSKSNSEFVIEIANLLKHSDKKLSLKKLL